jgi:uncharacterized protein
MFIKRKMYDVLLSYGKKFPAIAIMGPRQSGKTTLAQEVFKEHRYVLLEELDERLFAEQDPRGFLASRSNKNGIILDEIQEAPHLLSYIQGIIDKEDKPGFFILTGSQNFVLNQSITQTLAGRVAMLTLLPLSISELKDADLLPKYSEELSFKGCYPRLYKKNFLPSEWYPSYIKNYIERDVRQIVSIDNLSTFQRFIRLCAGRIGQILNLSSLGNDCGISHNTARSWLTLLEASYIVFLLEPYYKNFSKRLIKSPKIYFYDTGLACSLLKINSVEQLNDHYLRGGLFESLIISDLMKNSYNKALDPSLYFWRDSQGHEIDCLIEKALKMIPIEIKAGYTINKDFFKGLNYWNNLTSSNPKNGYIIYSGNEVQHRSLGNVLSWRELEGIE